MINPIIPPTIKVVITKDKMVENPKTVVKITCKTTILTIAIKVIETAGGILSNNKLVKKFIYKY